MLGNLGMSELMIIFLVVLLIFGAKRIPEIARGLGKGIREFKDATKDVQREMNFDDNRQYQVEAPRQQAAPQAQNQPVAAETQA